MPYLKHSYAVKYRALRSIGLTAPSLIWRCTKIAGTERVLALGPRHRDKAYQHPVAVSLRRSLLGHDRLPADEHHENPVGEHSFPYLLDQRV